MLSQNWRDWRKPYSIFWLMLAKPAQAIERVLVEPPSFISLVLFITVISLLRGILDGVQTLLTDGQLVAIWRVGRLFAWFVIKAYPLLLADWLAGYVRWLGFALAAYFMGRFCSGTGKMVDFLRLYGIALGIYVVTVLPNFAYFFIPLPMLRFQVSSTFAPSLGIGQILTTLWLMWVTYSILKRAHCLPRFESAVLGFLVPMLNIAALILPGTVIFNFTPAVRWGSKMVAYGTLLGFSLASLVLIAALAAWIRRASSSSGPILEDKEEEIIQPNDSA